MDKLDEFLERIGVELLPYQKEILQNLINDRVVRVIFPRYNSREKMLRLVKRLNEMKSEE